MQEDPAWAHGPAEAKEEPLKEHSECPLCGCENCVVLQTGVRHDSRIEVRRCPECELVFLWPQPSRENLDQYYRDVYREEDEHPTIRERFVGNLSEARTRVARLQPILKPNMRLLEVGCGSGAFLGTVRPHVGYAAGVELDSIARQWIAEELRLPVAGSIEELPDAEGSFDVVVLLHVLEHISRPVEFLGTLKGLLRPGGTLVVEVPNVEDALIGVYQIPACRNFYFQKAHLWNFSTSTLEMMLVRVGFEAAVRGVQRYDLSNHMRWMMTGEPGGQAFYGDVILPGANAAYADSLVQAGCSDTLWALAKVGA
jgi:SAM-dependent methyltransferase